MMPQKKPKDKRPPAWTNYKTTSSMLQLEYVQNNTATCYIERSLLLFTNSCGHPVDGYLTRYWPAVCNAEYIYVEVLTMPS